MKASILSFAFRGELLNFDDKSGVNARLEGIHKKIKNFKPILEQEKLGLKLIKDIVVNISIMEVFCIGLLK